MSAQFAYVLLCEDVLHLDRWSLIGLIDNVVADRLPCPLPPCFAFVELLPPHLGRLELTAELSRHELTEEGVEEFVLWRREFVGTPTGADPARSPRRLSLAIPVCESNSAGRDVPIWLNEPGEYELSMSLQGVRCATRSFELRLA